MPTLRDSRRGGIAAHRRSFRRTSSAVRTVRGSDGDDDQFQESATEIRTNANPPEQSQPPEELFQQNAKSGTQNRGRIDVLPMVLLDLPVLVNSL